MIQAVIFDMDGVLIDSESLHSTIEIELMKEFGVRITRAVTNEFMGVRFEEYFNVLKERYGLKVGLDEMLQKHHQIAGRYYGEIFPPMPHVEEVLSSLSAQYPLALVTSSQTINAKALLQRLGLSSYFSVLVCAEDVNKGKPDPEPYVKAAQCLKIKPENILVVEDAVNGFKSAKAAGMHLIAYKSEHNANQDFSLADRVVEDLREIASIATAT